MKQTLLFLFCATVLVQTARAQSCVDTTHITTFHWSGKKYEVVKEQQSWDSAAACAAKRGGYLAQIGSQAENDTIFNAIVGAASVSPTYTTAPDGGGIAYVWIGATDKKTEGAWLWDGDGNDTGVNFWNGQGTAGAGGGTAAGGAYNNWGRNAGGTIQEPDDFAGMQDAAGMALASWPYGSPKQWNDINRTNTLYYVIEYDNTTTTGMELGNTEMQHALFHPNPAQNEISISAAITINARFVVFDELGRIVTAGIYEAGKPISVAHLPVGTYVAMIQTDRNIYRSRLVISH